MALQSATLVYATININDLGDVDFSQVVQTSSNTIRKSLDGSLFIIKWNVEPAFITSGLVVPVQTLTHSEALILFHTSYWMEPPPPPD